MSKSNLTETDILKYVFNNTAFSWGAATSLYVSLHTADPTESGTQDAFEATYTGYQRVEVLRNATGWTVSGNTAQNTALVQFPQCTGGSDTITHVSIGNGSVKNTATQILYSGTLNSNLNISNLIQPQFSAGSLTVQED